MTMTSRVSYLPWKHKASLRDKRTKYEICAIGKEKQLDRHSKYSCKINQGQGIENLRLITPFQVFFQNTYITMAAIIYLLCDCKKVNGKTQSNVKINWLVLGEAN